MFSMLRVKSQINKAKNEDRKILKTENEEREKFQKWTDLFCVRYIRNYGVF